VVPFRAASHCAIVENPQFVPPSRVTRQNCPFCPCWAAAPIVDEITSVAANIMSFIGVLLSVSR
jgi:hypothetical protein